MNYRAFYCNPRLHNRMYRRTHIPPSLEYGRVATRKTARKVSASFTLDPASVDWLDRVVKERRYRNKSHAVDHLIQRELAEERR